LNAGRYFDLDSAFAFDPAGTPTFFARRFYDLALSLTVRTGPHHAEKALLITRLAAAAAGHTSLGVCSLFAAVPVTFIAFFESRDAQLLILAGCRIFERYL